MAIKFDVITAIQRGLRSKNLVFNREFERQGEKIYQQIFHNRKNGDIVLKQITQNGQGVYTSNSYGFAGKLRVLPWNKTERVPVWDYVKKESLAEGQIPFNLVNEVTPTKAVCRNGLSNSDFHLMSVAQNGNVTHYDRSILNNHFIPGETEKMTMREFLNSGNDNIYIS